MKYQTWHSKLYIGLSVSLNGFDAFIINLNTVEKKLFLLMAHLFFFAIFGSIRRWKGNRLLSAYATWKEIMWSSFLLTSYSHQLFIFYKVFTLYSTIYLHSNCFSKSIKVSRLVTFSSFFCIHPWTTVQKSKYRNVHLPLYNFCLHSYSQCSNPVLRANPKHLLYKITKINQN